MNIVLIAAALIGGCNVQQKAIVSHQQALVSHQAVIVPHAVQQQVLYFVGAPLRVQSLVEVEKRSDGDYQEYLQFKAWKAGRANQAQQAMTADGEPVPPPNPVPAASAVSQHCAKCHGTATPEGGFFLDGQPGMRPQDITAALRAIASGEMPKGRKLSREEKNQLAGELLSLEQPVTEDTSQ